MAHIYDSTGKELSIDKLLSGPDAHIWKQGVSNEMGRLTRRNDAGVSWTDTMEFIAKAEVPQHKKVTCCSFVCDLRPYKKETHCVCLVVGGNKLDCEFNTSSPAASMLDTKILCNSVISDAPKGAKFLDADLKDFFLMPFMDDPEHMKIAFKYFPQDIIRRYDLHNKVAPDGYVCIKIKRGMHGLKQAAILAYEQLVENLTPYGYHPIPHTNFWKYDN